MVPARGLGPLPRAVLAVGLVQRCALLGLGGLVLLVGFDARGYIASHPSAQVPGLSLDQNLMVAWTMVLFWGFVWPWLLVAMHKRPLRQLVTCLITEVDARP